jgi:hypothetical protein
LQF